MNAQFTPRVIAIECGVPHIAARRPKQSVDCRNGTFFRESPGRAQVLHFHDSRQFFDGSVPFQEQADTLVKKHLMSFLAELLANRRWIRLGKK